RVGAASKRDVLEVAAVGTRGREPERPHAARDVVGGAALAGRSGQPALERVIGQIADGCERLLEIPREAGGIGAGLRVQRRGRKRQYGRNRERPPAGIHEHWILSIRRVSGASTAPAPQ